MALIDINGLCKSYGKATGEVRVLDGGRAPFGLSQDTVIFRPYRGGAF